MREGGRGDSRNYKTCHARNHSVRQSTHDAGADPAARRPNPCSDAPRVRYAWRDAIKYQGATHEHERENETHLRIASTSWRLAALRSSGEPMLDAE